MKKTEIQTLNLAPEVESSLIHYNGAIDNAMNAVQKLEAICITKRLAEMFWAEEGQTAEIIKEDYLVSV